MQIVVCCDKNQQEALRSAGVAAGYSVEYTEDLNGLHLFPHAEIVLDLLFTQDDKRIERLRKSGKTVIVSSVISTLAESDSGFIRINGWPGFLRSPLMEAACLHDELKEKADPVFKVFHKQPEWLPDESGFITPRIISMIINEAYFAVSEGVSTKAEIDAAMKLGTAYPYGPFEWAQKIGLDNIASLLACLARHEERYAPCSLLLEEAERLK